MENQVPYIVHESAQARAERIIKRLVVALIVAVALMFVSNGLWLYAWCQYDYTGETTETETVYTQDGEGVNIIGDANHVTDEAREGYDAPPDAHQEG